MTPPRFRIVGMENDDIAPEAATAAQRNPSLHDTTIMHAEDVLENSDDPKSIAHMFDALHRWVDATINDTDKRGEAHHAVEGLTGEGARRMYALMTRNDISRRDSFLRERDLNSQDLDRVGINPKRWEQGQEEI